MDTEINYSITGLINDKLDLIQPKEAGVYMIKNLINGKFYIGSAVNLKMRYYQHKSKLRLNKHHNQHLQNAWNKYGSKNFLFIPLKNFKRDELIKAEQELLNMLEPWDRKVGYNISQSSDMLKYNLGKKMSNEQKKKISESCKKALKIDNRNKATKENYRKAQLNATAVTYSLINPNGEIVRGKGITELCQLNNLYRNYICKLIKGKIKQYKGWKVCLI